jgi:hypothetical protein
MHHSTHETLFMDEEFEEHPFTVFTITNEMRTDGV